jgi:Ca-activated chloride channel family protein
VRGDAESTIHSGLIQVFAGILFSLLVVCGQPQGATSEATLPPSNASVSQELYRSDATFRIHSDLVLIPVTVTDGKGRVVTSLEKEHFTLYQDKVQQEITHFASEDAPASIGILFDTSDSMAPKLSKAREAVAALLATANPDDEFFFVKFSTEPVLLVPLTTEREKIRNAMATLTVEGTTALLDAVIVSMAQMRNARYTRKALIIISDGEDNASHCSVHDLKEKVGQGDVLMYAIGFTEPANYSSTSWPPPPRPGSSLLTEITRETGGRLFETHKLKELPEIASRISGWLRSQYVLGYAPGRSADNRTYHRIQIRLTKPNGFPRLHAFWRLGYYDPTD